MVEVRVEPVVGRADRKAFVELPYRLYRGDPCWVPPLRSERRAFLDPDRNPFFEHAEVELWLARRGREVVGRIATHVDRLHQQVWGQRLAMFGLFETVDDPDVADALLRHAVDWARARGMPSLRGPLSFSQHHECGLLVDGFDVPPTLMMPYNPPSYAGHLERAGLVKAMDLLSFVLRRDDAGRNGSALPPRLVQAAEIARARDGAEVFSAQKLGWSESVGRVGAVYRRAWRANWGFLPLTDSELRWMASEIRPAVDLRLALFAVVGGHTAGFALGVRDLNQVLARLGGRILPFGWVRAALALRRVDCARLLLFGVLPEYRGRGLDALLLLETIRAALAAGYRTLELSWVLESNAPALHLASSLGGGLELTPARRHRLYEMRIEP